MRLFILFFLLLIYAINGTGQDLKEMRLNKTDIQNGIKYKYEYNETYYHIQLLLYKNGLYKYVLRGCIRALFSEGKWAIKDGILLLNSSISKNAVPVSVSYSDTGRIVNGSNIVIVANRKGRLRTDVLVNINVDSVKCLPFGGGCVGTYSTIDSLRLLFDNEFSSKWMKVKDVPDKNIYITVEVDQDFWRYTAFYELWWSPKFRQVYLV